MIMNGSWLPNITDESFVGTGDVAHLTGRRITERNLCGCGDCDGWDRIGWVAWLDDGSILQHVRPENIVKDAPAAQKQP